MNCSPRPLVLTLVLVLGALGARAQPGEGVETGGADHASARAFLWQVERLRREAKIPGLAVVVLRDGVTLLAEGLGFADLAERRAVTPETPFNIASVTKPISAVVALRLVERGQLNLDRPMSEFDGFSEFRTAARAEGGIFFRDFDDNPTRPVTVRQVLAMTSNGTPGTRFFYNPPAYSWASRPMAQVSKTSFSELTALLVFEPAGMKHSARIHRALPLRTDLAETLAKPYHLDPDGTAVLSAPPPAQGDGAAGGVISTALDLGRFDRALDGGQLLSLGSRHELWSAGRGPGDRVLPYGLGWFVQDYQGERLYWHSGLWEGAYSALYLKMPDRNLTLILLANSDGLRWQQRLDEAAVERSPFVQACFQAFPR